MERIERSRRVAPKVAPLMLAVLAGCSPPPDMRDQRLAEYARQSVEQQAEQNQQMARQSQMVAEQGRQLAEASRELVANDSRARQELFAAQARLAQQINDQRAAVDAGRDQLELQRRQIAEERRRDPIVAESIEAVGLLLACLAPLLLAGYVLYTASRSVDDDHRIVDYIVSELAFDEPLWLGFAGKPPALEDARSANT